MGNNMKTKYTLLTLVLCTVLTSTAIADSKAVITHRQGIYTIGAGHMKALKSILFQGHPLKSDVSYHANGIMTAFKHHGNAFPEGSNKGKTRAKDEIWSDPKGFEDAGNELIEALQGLIETADFEDMGEMQAAFKKVGKGCKNCHDNFREEE